MKQVMLIMAMVIMGFTAKAQNTNKKDQNSSATSKDIIIDSKVIEKYQASGDTDILNFNELISKYSMDSIKMIVAGYINKGLDIQSAKAVHSYLDSLRTEKPVDYDIYQNRKVMADKIGKK
jgi:hypothetical protein